MARQISTPHLGIVDFKDDDVLQFPDAIPGFPDETEFVIVQDQRSPVLCYLQSVLTPGLRFLIVPVAAVDQRYELRLCAADIQTLFPGGEPVDFGALACWFVVAVRRGATATINKLAPIVVRVEAGLGVQAVRSDFAYSHDAPLIVRREPAGDLTCSS